MKKSKKLINFETKKTVHFNMTRESHKHFRIACFKHGVTMQDVLEEIAQMIAHENPVVIRILERLERKKRDEEIKRLTDSDAESIFKAINDINPLKGG